METFLYICLFIFGTLFGSFSSVLIYRLKKKEQWITMWRSHCPKCLTPLKAIDLIPIVSWLFNKAKCRYCKEKVSSIYPILELSTWVLFAMIWYFLIDPNLIFALNWLEITKLLFWLIIWFITIIYTFYDILFLEIHEWVLFSWVLLIFIAISAQTLYPPFALIETLPLWLENISASFAAIVIASIIIWILYIIMTSELHEIVDVVLLSSAIFLLYLFKIQTWMALSEVALLNSIVWVLIIFIFFFIQIVLSWWSWMWWWDLRIAIMIWLILWISLSVPWLMITYMVWSIIWIWYLIHSKIKYKWKKLDTQIPFWPFLAIWFFATMFYSTEINNIIWMYF